MSDMQNPFPALNADVVDAGNGGLTDHIVDGEFLQYRQKCGRFRVLVLGSSGAGKTTLLERFTGDSIDKAEIRAPHGELVRISVSDPPSGLEHPFVRSMGELRV